jgi:hypothetical protein
MRFAFLAKHRGIWPLAVEVKDATGTQDPQQKTLMRPGRRLGESIYWFDPPVKRWRRLDCLGVTH